MTRAGQWYTQNKPSQSGRHIVDILVATDTLSVPAVQMNAMQDLGYECLGAGSVAGRVHFRKRGPRQFNVSVVLRGGDLWRDNLLVRDYLRALSLACSPVPAMIFHVKNLRDILLSYLPVNAVHVN